LLEIDKKLAFPLLSSNKGTRGWYGPCNAYSKLANAIATILSPSMY